MPVAPGQIYWAYAGGEAPHPAVVVSRDELNRGGYVVAVLLTSTRLAERWGSPNCVPFRAGQFGLTKDCVAQAESLTLLETGDLDLETGPIGDLDGAAMRDLIRAIGYVIGAECEPV